MSVSRNKDVVRRFIDGFMNAGDGAVADALVARDFVEHEPTPVPVRGPQGLKDFFGILRTAFPDLRFEDQLGLLNQLGILDSPPPAA